jgi:glucosamine-6-phosphate deaminase
VIAVADPRAAALALGAEIEQLALDCQAQGRALVLGLATGRTPVAVYEELVSRVESGRLDLSAAHVFNLDEYVGLGAEDPRSFAAWMRARFFDRIGLEPSRAHIPDGRWPAATHAARCAEYEARIRELGGIDLQLLGIGRNGHIGFNEPGSTGDSRTRRVSLDEMTRQDAARDFGSLEAVPTEALSMAVATILDARRVRLLAFGQNKRAALNRALAGPPAADCPASFLALHPDVLVFADAAALQA